MQTLTHSGTFSGLNPQSRMTCPLNSLYFKQLSLSSLAVIGVSVVAIILFISILLVAGFVLGACSTWKRSKREIRSLQSLLSDTLTIDNGEAVYESHKTSAGVFNVPTVAVQNLTTVPSH